MPHKPKRAPAKPSKPRAKALAAPSVERKPHAAAEGLVSAPEAGGPQTDPAVITFLRELEHPLKQEIEAVRQILLGISPDIREELKWNAPSFRTRDHFATFHLRSRDRVRLILHTGAKVKETATTGMSIADPEGLLEWLAKDRCLVTLADGEDLQAKRPALEAVVRAWIGQLRSP